MTSSCEQIIAATNDRLEKRRPSPINVSIVGRIFTREINGRDMDINISSITEGDCTLHGTPPHIYPKFALNASIFSKQI
jgi:hypothetical protein